MNNSNHLNQEWVAMSCAWIKEAREGPNPTREALLDAPMLEACGDVAGLRVVDCGCGEGRFCRKLLERGAAYALGLDLCEPMIAAARELQSNRDEYRIADVHDLSSLPDASFDIAVSYLNQCDLPDFKANNSEVFRILKPGGRFVVANLHPMRSAVGGWERDDSGAKRHVILDNYFDESERQWRMMGHPFTNFHRSLATYINGFLVAGFQLGRIVEPSIDPALLKDHPGLDDELRVPNFIIYLLYKP